jgi:hypothetical protein
MKLLLPPRHPAGWCHRRSRRNFIAVATLLPDPRSGRITVLRPLRFLWGCRRNPEHRSVHSPGCRSRSYRGLGKTGSTRDVRVVGSDRDCPIALYSRPRRDPPRRADEHAWRSGRARSRQARDPYAEAAAANCPKSGARLGNDLAGDSGGVELWVRGHAPKLYVLRADRAIARASSCSREGAQRDGRQRPASNTALEKVERCRVFLRTAQRSPRRSYQGKPTRKIAPIVRMCRQTKRDRFAWAGW